MGRIQENFARNAHRGVGGLLPYFTSGFPDSATSAALIRCADQLGATVIEVGEPYSDSIADGPVIQESFNAALSSGHRVGHTFEMIASLRREISCALVWMGSYSVVHRIGLDTFTSQAAGAGFDGLIIPDIPADEAFSNAKAARSAGLDYIGFIAPTTSPARRETIARMSAGFIYQIAVAGTTGVRAGAPPHLRETVTAIRALSSLPVCVGFGVGSASAVREICRFADGAIVGSAIVRRIAEAHARDPSLDAVVAEARSFLSELMTGLDGRDP